MKKSKELSKVNYIINPNLQGKKYEFTPESKAFLEKGEAFLKEKVLMPEVGFLKDFDLFKKKKNIVREILKDIEIPTL